MRKRELLTLAIALSCPLAASAGIWCTEKVAIHALTIRHDAAKHCIRADVDYDMSCPQPDPSKGDGCKFYKTLYVFVQDSQHPRVEWAAAWMQGRFGLGCQPGTPTQPPDLVGPDRKTDPTLGTLCHDPHYGGGYVRIMSTIQKGDIRPDGSAKLSQRTKKVVNLCGL